MKSWMGVALIGIDLIDDAFSRIKLSSISVITSALSFIFCSFVLTYFGFERRSLATENNAGVCISHSHLLLLNSIQVCLFDNAATQEREASLIPKQSRNC